MSVRTKTLSFIAIAAMAVVGILVWSGLGHRGVSELENWIGRQIVGALQSYVSPSIEFDDLQYTAPRGVAIDGLRFTSGDTRILLMDRVELELAEIPRTGRPIKISRIRFDRPQVRFVTDAQGDLKGWSGFIRPDPLKDPASVPQGQRFSDILELRHVEFHDGRVVYDPGGGRQSMTIPGIELSLDTPPAAEPGWYNLVGTFKRSPLLEAAFDARINLNTALLEVKKLALSGELGEKQYATLPPPVQELLRRHQVQGTLTANLSGSVPIADASKSNLQWDASLQRARFALNGALIPLESIQTTGKFPEGPLSFSLRGFELSHENQPLVKIKAASVAMDQLPGEGKAWDIDRVTIEGGRLYLAGGEGKGLTNWRPIQNAQSTSAPSLDSLRTILRDVSIRTLKCRDLGLRYQAASVDAPIEIAGCDMDINTIRSSDNHRLTVQSTVTLLPLLTAKLDGIVPLDETPLDLTHVQVDLDLRSNAIVKLPDALRAALTSQGLEGQLSAKIQGHINPGNWVGSSVDGEVALTKARARIGEVKMATDRLNAQFQWPAGQVTASTSGLSLQRGDLTFFATHDASLDAAREGAVLIIKRLTMNKPTFELVQEPSGAFSGWGSPGQGQTNSSIQFRQVDLRGADIIYRPIAPQAPIAVEGVDLSFNLLASAKGGTHTFIGKLSRPPLLDVSATGTYEPVGSILDLQKFQLTAHLKEESYAALPPRMRDTLQHYQLAGEIELSAHTRVALTDLAQAKGQAVLDITKGRAAIRETTWPVQDLHIEAGFPDGPVEVTAKQVQATAGNVKFFSLDELKFELPAIPAPGRPIEVHRLEFQRPSVQMIRDAKGQIAGWGQLFSNDSASSGSSFDRLVLLEELQIKQGEFFYDDPGDKTPVMSLPGIDLVLRMPEISGSPDVHGFKGTIRRDPVLSISFDGKVNVDEARLELVDCQISADLGDREYGALPPALQQLLRSHEVQGDFDATVIGQIPLRDPLAMDTRFTATLQKARIAFDDIVWPIQRMKMTGAIAKHRMESRYDASLLDGVVGGAFTYGLLDDQPFDLTWRLERIRIEKTLRVIDQNEPRYSGRMSSQGKLGGKAGQLPASLSGQADLNVTGARLMRMPIVREILTLVAATRIGFDANDSARVNIQFRPDRLKLANLDMTSALVSLRGGGDVLYDGRIDMNITADLLQRVGKTVDQLPILDKLQPFKRITGAIGTITDRAVVYEVRGTLSEPRVRVKPLGLGR